MRFTAAFKLATEPTIRPEVISEALGYANVGEFHNLRTSNQATNRIEPSLREGRGTRWSLNDGLRFSLLEAATRAQRLGPAERLAVWRTLTDDVLKVGIRSLDAGEPAILAFVLRGSERILHLWRSWKSVQSGLESGSVAIVLDMGGLFKRFIPRLLNVAKTYQHPERKTPRRPRSIVAPALDGAPSTAPEVAQ